jgi:hypothetical protein
MRSPWISLKRILGRQRDLQLGLQADHRQPLTRSRGLAVLFWLYVAQAVAGSVIGFTAPFLYFFGVL